MDVLKDGESIIMFAQGFIGTTGDMNVSAIFDYARDQAHLFAGGLYSVTRDLNRMRLIVDHFSSLYHMDKFERLRQELEDTYHLISCWIDRSNILLMTEQKKLLRTYESGFVRSLDREMEMIEMFVNAGVDRKNIAIQMGYPAPGRKAIW